MEGVAAQRCNCQVTLLTVVHLFLGANLCGPSRSIMCVSRLSENDMAAVLRQLSLHPQSGFG